MFDYDDDCGVDDGGVTGYRVMVDPAGTVFDPDDQLDWYRLTVEQVSLPVTDRSCPDDVIGLLRYRAKMVARYQAGVYQSMMAVVAAYQNLDDSFGVGDMFDMTAAELRACLHMTRNAADLELGYATDLVERLPLVLEALKQGRIDVTRAKVLSRETSHLDVGEARMVCQRVLDRAENLTGTQLAALTRRVCIEIDPDTARKRHDRAVKDRGVWSRLTETSTSEITGWGLCPIRVAQIMNRIDSAAKHLATRSETRTLDQIRADIFLDLLEGTHPNTYRRGVTDIRVELTTLLGLDQHAVEVAGYGPVIKDILDQFNPDNQWQVTITSHGRPVDTILTRRRPTQPMRRQVETRDQTCVFPGCRTPATGCDLDHRTPYAQGGLTHPHHLDPLCRHDHVIHHKAGWTRHPNPDGSHTWHSPLGATYTRPPP